MLKESSTDQPKTKYPRRLKKSFVIYNKFHKILRDFLDIHSKVFYIRFDIRFPVNYINDGSNSEIIKFFYKTSKKYTQVNIDSRYIWTREQNTSNNPHYHVVMLFDGHKIKSMYKVIKSINKIWNSILCTTNESNYIHHCHGKFPAYPHGVMLNRDGNNLVSSEAYRFVTNGLSYLTKFTDINHNPYRIREFGVSRFLVENTSSTRVKSPRKIKIIIRSKNT